MTQQKLFDGTKYKVKENKRKTPLDIIYTAGGGDSKDGIPRSVMTHCCLAVASGWMYGFQSAMASCASALYKPSHLPQFIDNDFYHYDHARHLSQVQKWKPKYATVCDIMTKEQCAAAKIEYHPLEQILDWAEELTQYAQNVIVIPKWNCLDKIPQKFMLGYSVPTSHGGTPLQPELFKGWRVHLLGGSWKAQLAHLAILKDDVVSIDNNYILKQAKYAGFVFPDGRDGHLTEDCNVNPKVANPMYICLALSFGNIVAAVNEMYSAQPKTVFDLTENTNGE